MATSSIGVSVVITNYNGARLLKKNLPKITAAKNNSQNKIKEIIVVDDASTDDSIELLKEQYRKEIRVFQHKKNRGFACASNLGVRMARSKVICLLNTDVYPSKNFLTHALKHFEDPLVFGVTLHEKDFGPGKGVFEKGFIEIPGVKARKKPMQTFWVSGGSGLFRRSIWMKLKGFDEKLFYPYYWEDVDLSYRAAKRGYKLIWEPSANVVHKHEGAIKNTSKEKERNAAIQKHQLIFIWKNITSRGLFRKHLRGLIKRTSSHPGYIKVIASALKEVKEIRRKRTLERKESKISDEAIFARFT